MRRIGKVVYKIIAARPAAMAPRPMLLTTAALVTWTGPVVVGVGPVVPTTTGVVDAGGAGLLAGGTTADDAGVETAYVVVLKMGTVTVVGVLTEMVDEPVTITVGVGPISGQ